MRPVTPESRVSCHTCAEISLTARSCRRFHTKSRVNPATNMARVENPSTMDDKGNADLDGDESKRRLVLEPYLGLGTSPNHRGRKNSAQAWHSLSKLTIISGHK